MAKGLLGSGSKGRGVPVPGKFTPPGHNAAQPWINTEKKAAADNAAGAGKQLKKALDKSKSTGIKP